MDSIFPPRLTPGLYLANRAAAFGPRAASQGPNGDFQVFNGRLLACRPTLRSTPIPEPAASPRPHSTSLSTYFRIPQQFSSDSALRRQIYIFIVSALLCSNLSTIVQPSKCTPPPSLLFRSRSICPNHVPLHLHVSAVLLSFFLLSSDRSILPLSSSVTTCSCTQYPSACLPFGVVFSSPFRHLIIV